MYLPWRTGRSDDNVISVCRWVVGEDGANKLVKKISKNISDLPKNLWKEGLK